MTPLAPSAPGITPPVGPSVPRAGSRDASAAMGRRGCARRAGWVPLVMVAVWVAIQLLRAR